MTSETILSVENLRKYFNKDTNFIQSLLGSDEVTTRAVDDVTFDIKRNEAQAVIGESGCGKSTLLMTLMGLLDRTGGTIEYKGKQVSEFGRSDWKSYRSNIQIIFQDPFNSLDPKYTVRESLEEPLQIHDIGDRDRRVRDICEQVKLTPVDDYLDRRPEQLSGGELQRVSIARALIIEPEVILADEPVSMLDVSTQASILNLLAELIEDMGVALLYISHDLSTVSYVSDTINVMYLGRIVESGPTEQIIDDPKHPYSQALINAIPIPDPYYDRQRTLLEGTAEHSAELWNGCRFRDRCPDRMDICETVPRTVEVDDQHHAACHLYYEHDQATAGEVTGDD